MKNFTKIAEPQLKVFDTALEVDRYVAYHIIAQIKKNPHSIVTLPTGSTPKGAYQLLIDAYQQKKVDFSHISLFELDEYYPISPDDPVSVSYRMKHEFLNFINMPEKNWYRFDGLAPDIKKECKRFQKMFKEYGPADLAVVGIGPGLTCHIGMNEPGSTLESGIRAVKLTEDSRKATGRKSAIDIKKTPKIGLTQGINTLLSSKKIILIAKGKEKTLGVNRALEGKIGSGAPASFLRLHHNLTVVLDVEAAGEDF